MSDSEVSSESDSLSERRDTNCSPSSDLDDTGGHFVFRRDFAPYQGEPLAANGEMADNGNDEEDEDGILPSVLEQRFEREVR